MVLARVVDAAYDMDYPLVALLIGVQAHAAPRFARTAAGCIRTGVVPDTSMLAGDGQSNSWARALLYDLLGLAHSRYMPVVRISQYVDDLAQRG